MSQLNNLDKQSKLFDNSSKFFISAKQGSWIKSESLHIDLKVMKSLATTNELALVGNSYIDKVINKKRGEIHKSTNRSLMQRSGYKSIDSYSRIRETMKARGFDLDEFTQLHQQGNEFIDVPVSLITTQALRSELVTVLDLMLLHFLKVVSATRDKASKYFEGSSVRHLVNEFNSGLTSRGFEAYSGTAIYNSLNKLDKLHFIKFKSQLISTAIGNIRRVIITGQFENGFNELNKLVDSITDQCEPDAPPGSTPGKTKHIEDDEIDFSGDDLISSDRDLKNK